MNKLIKRVNEKNKMLKTKLIMNRLHYKKVFNRFTKSSIVIIMLLTLLVGSISIFPTKAYAGETGTKKYIYTFDFGTYDGAKLTYEIRTTETLPVKTRKDITVDKAQAYGSLLNENPQNTTDCTSLVQYMRDQEIMLVYAELTEPSRVAMRDTFKKLCFAIVDAPYDYQTSRIELYANAYCHDLFDWNNMMEYVSNHTATRLPDPNYSGYYWGAWKHNGVEDDFYDNLYKETDKNPLVDTKFFNSFKIKLPDYSDQFYSFASGDTAIVNDRFLCYVITHSVNNGNKFGFDKKEVDETVGAEVNFGDYSYVALEDSIDPVKATIDVEVYHHKTNASGGDQKTLVHKFRYTKGGTMGTVTDSLVSVYYDTQNFNTGEMNSYKVNSTLRNTRDGTLKMYPKVSGTTLNNSGFGGQWYKKTVGSDVDVAYSSSNYKIMFSDAEKFIPFGSYDEAIGYTFSYGAVSQTNYVDVIESHRLISAKDKTPLLGTDTAHGEKSYETTSWIQTANTIITIDKSILDGYFDDSIEPPVGDQLDCGNWHLSRISNDNMLVAWNDNLADGEEQCYFIMDWKKGAFYNIEFQYFIGTQDVSYHLHLKKNEDKTAPKPKPTTYLFTASGASYGNRYCATLVAPNSSKGSITEGKQPSQYLQNMIDIIAIEDTNQVHLRFYDISNPQADGTKRGKNTADSFYIVPEAFVHETASGGIVDFDITPWFKEMYEQELEKSREEQVREHYEPGGGLGAIYMTQDQLNEKQTTFIKMLMRYGKPIIMFLVFLMVVWTGIYSIIHNQDAKERVLVKEKLKHILVGVIMFAVVVGILFLCKQLMDSSYDKIEEITSASMTSNFDVPEPDYDTNWAVNLIVSLINAVANIIDWLINTILCAVIGGTGTDLNYVIFNDGVADSDYDLAPYTESEWQRYMYGYQALESLALALLAIAIVKMAFDLVIHAESQEKKTEIKMTCLRIATAMLAIVLGPYAVRLLLLLFNSLITLVPIKSIDMDLAFDGDTGILGASASVIFAWTKFKIYLAFVVRKLMITFMMLMTPVVFGLWAISDKFRSLSLWIGELVSNSATQFCYALVFFIASLIMYDNQSDFITLIIIMMFMQLADFFKDSLQGLIQKWGGIDETGVAGNVANKIRGFGRTGLGIAKRTVNRAGAFTSNVANFVDPNKTTGGGRVARNIGNVLQGNVWGWETKADTDKNAMKLLKGKASQENSKLAGYDRDFNKAKANNNLSDDYIENYEKARRGELSLDKTEELVALDPSYAKIHEMNKARSNRDQFDQGAKQAKADKKSDSNWIDNARSAAKDSVLDEYKYGGGEDINQAKQQVYERTRSDVANKTAKMDVTKELFEQGKASEDAFVKSVTEALKSATQLGSDGIKAGLGDKLATDIKRQIADAARSAIQGKDVSDGTRSSIEQLARDAYSMEGKTNAEQLASIQTQLDDIDKAEKQAFEDEKKKKSDAMKETFNL